MSDLAGGTSDARGSSRPPSGGAVQTPSSPKSTPLGRLAAWMTSAETGAHTSRSWHDCRGAAADRDMRLLETRREQTSEDDRWMVGCVSRTSCCWSTSWYLNQQLHSMVGYPPPPRQTSDTRKVGQDTPPPHNPPTSSPTCSPLPLRLETALQVVDCCRWGEPWRRRCVSRRGGKIPTGCIGCSEQSSL